MFRRPIVVLGVVLMVVGLGATVVTLRDSSSEPPATTGDAATSGARGVASSPQQRVARLQARVKVAPDDWEALAALGSAFVAEAAVTGDPALYPRAETSIERSLKVHPKGNLRATIAQSSLAAARHDFVLALKWGKRATALAPKDPNARAVLGDALLEVGRYDEAFAEFQRMIDFRPDLPSYSRISYARELQGDVDGAVKAMTAAEAAAGSQSDAAFAAFQLGELEWNRGYSEAAISHYRRALKRDPDAVRSQAALARVAFYAGDDEKAIDEYRAVVARLPLPQYVSELADVYTVTHQPDLAQDQLGLLDAQLRLYRAAGVAVDADIAIINANNGIDLGPSLAAMEAEWKVRKSIFVADAVGWLLHENGRSEEALVYSDKALEMGTRNALFYFHRSEIHRALGDDEAAKRDLDEARAINPNFSIRFSNR